MQWRNDENPHRLCRMLTRTILELGLRWHFWNKEEHHKQGRFKDTKFIQSNEKQLQMFSCNIPLSSAIDHLKTENHDCLLFRKQHSSLRDKLTNSNPERKEELKALRKKEKLKAKWRKCKLAFGKSRISLIAEVDCLKDGALVRTSN